MSLASMAATQSRQPKSGGPDITKGQKTGPKMRAIGPKGSSKWDIVELSFPFSNEALRQFQSVIPSKDRQWIGDRKVWRIKRSKFIDVYLTFPNAVMTPPLAAEARRYINKLRPQILEPRDMGQIPGLHAKLRPYQIAAIEFMLRRAKKNLQTPVWDEQRLGKTLISLGRAAADPDIPYDEVTGLIVCPNISKWGTWVEHIEDITDWDYSVIDGGTRKMESQFDEPVNWYIINWEAARNATEYIWGIDWDFIILDECHRMGNENSQQSKAILGTKAKWMIPMSGTPAQNRIEQYHPVFKWMGWNTQDQDEFKKEVCVIKEASAGGWRRYEKVVAYKNLGPLVEQLSKRTVRRTQDEVMPWLPRAEVQSMPVELHPSQKQMYNDLVETYGTALDETERVTYKMFENIITALLMVCQSPGVVEKKKTITDPETGKQKRVGTGIYGPDKSYKLDEIVNNTKEILEAGQKAVLLSAYRRTCDLLLKRLEPYTDCVMVRGGVGARKAAELKRQFQTNPDTGCYIGTIDANKESITLTAARYMHVAGLDWDPGDNLQAFARIRGQDKLREAQMKLAKQFGEEFTLMVYDWFVPGTIEVWFREVLSSKGAVLGLANADPRGPIERGLERELKSVLKKI